ncbi:ATP-binding cassette domain-containing protein [Nocardia sp. SC052]|uniref:ATP-binding cassette domain-containing protein n=1 Tax=Nocardia sichangensis TaxID=3385975 RepID=UPI0039A2A833
MNAQCLDLSDVSVGHGGREVLAGLDIAARQGEVVALLGRNGAGKTTLLRTLAGELPILGGQIVFEGSSLQGPLHRRARRGIAYIPEERAIIRSLSVANNLRLGSKSISKALDYFPELRPLMNRRAGLLSGGEQQMLAFARSLAADAKLLLIDELSLGLAPMATRRLLQAVRTAADGGVAVVVVEQHPGLILEIADRGYVLGSGGIALSGTRDELTGSLREIEAIYLSSGQG